MDPFGERQCNNGEELAKNQTDVGPVTDSEKGDLSPENSKKSDYSPLDDHISTEPLGTKNSTSQKMQLGNCNSYREVRDGHSVNKSMSMQEIKKDNRGNSEDPDVRNALAFTIDFSDGRKSIDAQRHEKMLERFQNRHKRGVSLSKLESGPPPGRIKPPQSVNLPRKNKNNLPEMHNTDVKLRDKNKSTKDAMSKRHSWSPRTSMTEVTTREPVKSGNKFTPRSTTLQMAFDQQNIMKDTCSSSELNAESLDSSLGLPCVEPPLESFEKDDDDESVSEAGTYTLDGDNYTEEQKERMNIDRMPALSSETTTKPFFITGLNKDSSPRRPTDFRDELEIIDLDQPLSGRTDERRKPNILEVTYFHDSSGIQPIKSKQSYLEKLKSRVKNITHKSKSPDKTVFSQQVDSSDQGTFTSVTTSGILSVKPNLDNRSGMQRRNSLTKSHIDSSEYVQGVAKLNIHKQEEAKILNCYTDSEKATGLSNYNKNYDCSRHKTSSDASVIGSVASKKDWIQEWAKNAREYSKKPVQKSNSNNVHSNMTRSYEFENSNQFGYDFDIDMTKSDYYDAKKYEEFGDNLDRQHLYRKQLDRLINDNCGSDPLIKPCYNNDGSSSFNEFARRGSMRQYTSPNASKPPMSPSKIPSPIGSVGRARSVSRNRSLQGSNSDLSTNETEMYLQKTAAAISTLQDLHRRNSLRCSSLHNSSHSSPQSPASRRISPKISPMNSLQSPVHHSYQDKTLNLENQSYSPHHQQLRNLKHHHHHTQQQQQNSINHKRNLSLDNSESYVNALSNLGFGNQMSNSLNTENMNAILDFKKQHTRHNSFEGMSSLPPKPVKCFQNFDQTNAYYREPLNDDQIISNEVDDEDDEESLLVVTTGVKDLSLGAKKTGLSIKQHSIPTGGKSTVMQMKATGAVTNRPENPKSVPLQVSSPIKRSSSFSVKAMKPTTPTLTPKLGSKLAVSGSRIQKSASSTSFKKMVANYNDNDDKFYINDDDDLELDPDYSSNSEFSDKDDEIGDIDKEPITNTRYNKTFLMRMEQNKKIAAGMKQGVAACPNTPELPRRTLQVRGAVRDRASMPRDSSLNRMKQDLHLSRKSVGKEFTSKESIPAAGTAGYQRVQPKYMDISKYKIPNTGTFLKKDESKSYLMKQDVKKSPSSASVVLNRIEPNRMSSRSVKSAGAKMPTCAKKDAQKQMKEQELEMWRRRASYDPMKAAMEGKRKQEEARRQAQLQNERLSKSNESSVLRSQSYHCGVGNVTGRSYDCSNSSHVSLRSSFDQTDNSSSSHPSNRWTESSDDLEDEYIK